MKKIISIILATLMVFTLIAPVSAAKETADFDKEEIVEQVTGFAAFLADLKETIHNFIAMICNFFKVDCPICGGEHNAEADKPEPEPEPEPEEPPVIAVEEVTVDKAEINLLVGESDKITVTVTPDDATDKGYTIVSSDEAVATVDAEGNITAIAAGTATITVTSNADATKQAVVAVTVAEPEIKVETVESLIDAIKNPGEDKINASGLGLVTTTDIGEKDGNYTTVIAKAGLVIKGLTVDFNGSNHVFVTEGEAGEIVFENCVFTCHDFDGKIYFNAGADASGVKLVFNNCTFKGMALFADATGGGVVLNNCNFELNDEGYGYAQLLGGTGEFNNCQFNFGSSKSFGSSSITKYGRLNLLSEKYSTVVILNKCNSVLTHTFRAGSGTCTIKTNN